MGVEYYVVCQQCKEYIDLHKAYAFSGVVDKERPPVAAECKETGFNEFELRGGYWESRGLWFLWAHRGHAGIELHSDSDDLWHDMEPHLTEKYPHNDDLKIRERVGGTKK